MIDETRHASGCPSAESDVLLYHAGDMTRDAADGFDAHLTGCAECRAALDRLRRVENAYHSVRAADPGAGHT